MATTKIDTSPYIIDRHGLRLPAPKVTTTNPTFVMYAFASDADGQICQIANTREWLPVASRSLHDAFTGKVYGKGKKAFAEASADSAALNANICRPVAA